MSRHPASLQSFREIREEGLSYADKTEHVHRLLMDGRAFRLTRPRASGKTLLVSAMKALFQGRADLFRGLYLGSSGWDFTRRPVLHLDFSRLGASGGPAALKEDLCWELRRAALKEELGVKGSSPGALAAWLVDALYAKHRRRPAVLVDNASAPLERHLGDPSGLRERLEALEGFWEALASMGPRLRFVFAAGAVCFRGMTGPEGFLKDVTVGQRHAASCGFTPAELDSVFGDSLAEAAELRRADGLLPGKGGTGLLTAEILRWYGGYSWDGENRVANPGAVLSFLESSENSWHFLEERPPDRVPGDVLAEAALTAPPGPELTFTRGLLSALDPAAPAVCTLLFQAGALTLTGKRDRDGVPEYSLGFPNREVEGGFRMLALAAVTGLDHASLRAHVRRFRAEAGEGRAGGAAAALAALLSASASALAKGPGRRAALYSLLLRLAGFSGGGAEAGFPAGAPGGHAAPASGSMRLEGGRRIQVTLRHVPAADGLGEGAARRVLQEALEAAVREVRDGEAPPEPAAHGQAAPAWEARRLFVFSAGASETAGASVDSGRPLLFRPLSRAEEA
jgi:hypothetical protein